MFLLHFFVLFVFFVVQMAFCSGVISHSTNTFCCVGFFRHKLEGNALWFAPEEPNLRQQPVEQLGERIVGNCALDDLPVDVEGGAQTDARGPAFLVHTGDFVDDRLVGQAAFKGGCIQPQFPGEGDEGGVFQIPEFALALEEGVVHLPEGDGGLLARAFCGLVGLGRLAVIENVP